MIATRPATARVSDTNRTRFAITEGCERDRSGGDDASEPEGTPALTGQGTILEIGSSRMSLPPAALSCGISRFTPRLSTTVSIAKPPSAKGDTVGAFIDGTTAST